jgi:hypothetical protein
MKLKKEPAEIFLTDLDLSMRTFELLSNLPISTLSELLSMPSIICSRLSKLELEGVFEENGVNYY